MLHCELGGQVCNAVEYVSTNSLSGNLQAPRHDNGNHYPWPVLRMLAVTARAFGVHAWRYAETVVERKCDEHSNPMSLLSCR